MLHSHQAPRARSESAFFGLTPFHHNMKITRHLAPRGDATTSHHPLTPLAGNLLFGLLILVFFGLGLTGVLCILRRRRAANKDILPTHQKNSNHRHLTIRPTPYAARTDSRHVSDEKRNLIENSSGPPDSPVPEIRITFPDEEDNSGRKQNGRVVLVRIGDSGSVGLEPVPQDRLPPYLSDETQRLQSLDLERMGGLKEKMEPRTWS